MTVENFTARNLRTPLVLGGERTREACPLSAYSERFKAEKARFWEEYMRRDLPHIYKVDLSPALCKLKADMVCREEGK